MLLNRVFILVSSIHAYLALVTSVYTCQDLPWESKSSLSAGAVRCVNNNFFVSSSLWTEALHRYPQKSSWFLFPLWYSISDQLTLVSIGDFHEFFGSRKLKEPVVGFHSWGFPCRTVEWLFTPRCWDVWAWSIHPEGCWIGMPISLGKRGMCPLLMMLAVGILAAGVGTGYPPPPKKTFHVPTKTFRWKFFRGVL